MVEEDDLSLARGMELVRVQLLQSSGHSHLCEPFGVTLFTHLSLLFSVNQCLLDMYLVTNIFQHVIGVILIIIIITATFFFFLTLTVVLYDSSN